MRALWQLAFLPARLIAVASCAAALVVVSPLLGWSVLEDWLAGDIPE